MRRSAGIRACRTCRCAISTCIRRSPGSAHHLDSSIDGSVATKPEPFHVPSNLVVRHVRRPADWVLSRPICCSDSGSSMAGIQWATASDSVVEIYARSVALRRRIVCCADRGSRRGEMAADRPLQGAIDSDLELCIFPLLGRQDPDAHIACGCLHRHTALQRLSAPDGRQDRPQRDR